jgi:NitT/TauT family transport system substrate-binding protein
MNAWRNLTLTVAVVFLIALAFLPRDEGQRNTIRVVIVKYLSFAPLIIAHEEGFFKAEGLEVELLPVTRVSTAIPALVQGDIDVLPAAIMPSYFNIINRGGLMRVVAGKGYIKPEGCAYAGIMARRSLLESDELSSASDLSGRRLSTDRTSPSYFKVDQYMKSSGLTLDDLEVVDIPLPAQFNAFERGTLDVATASEPWVTRLRHSGHADLLASAGDFLPDFQFGYLLFGKSLLKDRPEAGK